MIDAKSGKVLGTVAIGDKPEFAQIDAAGKIYFNGENNGELDVLDPRTLTLTQRTTLKPSDSPSGLAIDDKQSAIFGMRKQNDDRHRTGRQACCASGDRRQP